MSLVPVIGFVLVALLAIAFVAVPLWRSSQKKGRALLLGAIALFVLAIGGGTYFFVGRPYLAQRSAQGLNNVHDINGLVPYLITRVRAHPEDVRAWRYLASAYMAASDPRDAAKALAQVIALSGKGDAGVDAAYGEALVSANGGQVPDEAEEAFNAALKADPRNIPARFYLGMAKVGHGDRPGAIAIWQSLLADVPTTAPLHQLLIDRLGAFGGGFGQPAATTTSATGGAFGTGAFGQPAAAGGATGAFGQTAGTGMFGGFGTTAARPAAATGFGQTASTGFGQPAATGFGQTAATGFGQTASTGFGQPASGFGQPAATGFGQPASGFGQTASTGFGQTASTGFGQPASGFGQTASTGFGQTASTGFGQSAFGQTTSTGFGQSTFGSSALARPATAGGAFGAAPAGTGFGVAGQGFGGFGAAPAQVAQAQLPLVRELEAFQQAFSKNSPYLRVT